MCRRQQHYYRQCGNGAIRAESQAWRWYYKTKAGDTLQKRFVS